MTDELQGAPPVLLGHLAALDSLRKSVSPENRERVEARYQECLEACKSYQKDES